MPLHIINPEKFGCIKYSHELQRYVFDDEAPHQNSSTNNSHDDQIYERRDNRHIFQPFRNVA